MNALSVVIVARDEAGNIERCVKSVGWADEVLVVDTGSRDETVAIGRRMGARVEELAWEGFGRTRRRAVELARHDWVLSVDADEVVTEGLRDEVRALLRSGPSCAAYRIPRRSSYLGHRIRHCGWGHDRVTRLFDRRKGTFVELPVHEYVRVDGAVGKLRAPLEHYPYPDVATHVRKMNRYADLSAEILHEKGRRSSPAGAALRGTVRFVRMYVLQAGFLDGREGFLLCVNSARGVRRKYRKLWELGR
jgi:glycosyltransferase involved in cell wall biosynthesis